MALLSGGCFLYYHNKRNTVDGFNNDTKQLYVIDVYKKVALRRDGFVNAEVKMLLDAGDKVRVTGNVNNSMVEIVTEDHNIGYVQKKFLKRDKELLTRADKEQAVPQSEDLVFVSRASCINLYSYQCKHQDSAVIAEYLMRGTPLQILRELGNNTAEVIDCETGIVGIISDYKQVTTLKYEPVEEGRSTSGNLLGDGKQTGDYYDYPVNSDSIVSLYNAPDNSSEIVFRLRPGTWVNILSETKNGYCKVRSVYDQTQEGYIEYKQLYFKSN